MDDDAAAASLLGLLASGPPSRLVPPLRSAPQPQAGPSNDALPRQPTMALSSPPPPLAADFHGLVLARKQGWYAFIMVKHPRVGAASFCAQAQPGCCAQPALLRAAGCAHPVCAPLRCRELRQLDGRLEPGVPGQHLQDERPARQAREPRLPVEGRLGRPLQVRPAHRVRQAVPRARRAVSARAPRAPAHRWANARRLLTPGLGLASVTSCCARCMRGARCCPSMFASHRRR